MVNSSFSRTTVVRRLPSLVLAFLCLCPRLNAQQAFAPPVEPAQKIHGALVLAGGGSLPDSVYDAFLKLAGGADARLVIIPTAGGTEAVRMSTGIWILGENAGQQAWHFSTPYRLHKANESDFVKPLTLATGVWLGGGDQTRFVNAYRGTAVESELRKLLDRGGVIGGTSAGPPS